MDNNELSNHPMFADNPALARSMHYLTTHPDPTTQDPEIMSKLQAEMEAFTAARIEKERVEGGPFDHKKMQASLDPTHDSSETTKFLESLNFATMQVPSASHYCARKISLRITGHRSSGLSNTTTKCQRESTGSWTTGLTLVCRTSTFFCTCTSTTATKGKTFQSLGSQQRPASKRHARAAACCVQRAIVRKMFWDSVKCCLRSACATVPHPSVSCWDRARKCACMD